MSNSKELKEKKKLINKEIVLKKLEEKTKPQRENLIDFMAYIFEYEKKMDFYPEKYHYLLADKLKGVLEGKTKRLMINLPPRHGKLIKHNTPIISSKGWTTHGELNVGDYVYSPEGKPIKVLALSKEDYADLEVEFSNGEKIQCHSNHEWVVYNKGNGLKKEVRETKFMINKVYRNNIIGKRGGGYNFSVDYCKPLEFSKKKLLINPYLLGLWLGDGTSSEGRITMSKEDMDDILKESFGYNLGYRVVDKNTGVHTQFFKGMNKDLKTLNILNNKHIPDIYLMSSIEDRLDLLRGLIDSDGSIDKTGRVRFINTNTNIINGIKELISSLGYRVTEYKPKINTQHRLLNGKIIKNKLQCYVIGFTPYNDIKFSKIFRKFNKQKVGLYRRNTIVNIKKITPELGRCIQVEGGVYLVGKTFIPTHNSELITKCFPVWAMGNNPKMEFIATSYSATLSQGFAAEARDYYMSPAYKTIFPRADLLSEIQNTKDHWKLQSGGKYYSTGSGGAITGVGCSVFIIDDPLKPDEVDSDIKRIGINNWYENTVISRLNNPKTDAIIIIMQRLHDNDLCGYLKEKIEEGIGEKWEIVELPAIMQEDKTYNLSDGTEIEFKDGEILYPSKFTRDILNDIKQVNPLLFSCQWMQEPVSKENQEFHEEWFRYYDQLPNEEGRVFTTVDPAFSKKKTADESVITTVKFIQDKMYILEQTCGKYDPGELEEKMVYHIRKWDPEVIGIEAIAAQVTISFSLRRRLLKEELFRTQIEEIKQREDKSAKIRSLIPLYRNGLIFHKRQELDGLEVQLMKFPRGRHDDRADGLQMCLYLYELQPGNNKIYKMPEVKYNSYGMPVLVHYNKTLQY